MAKLRRNAHLPRRIERDRRIVERLETWLVTTLDQGSVVVLFDALPGEVDLSMVRTSSAVVDHRLSFALTRTPDTGFDLTVHPIDSPLEEHRFGYRQPVAGSPEILDSRIAAVMVPALAFDSSGNRLGFGAGYYDRFLARTPQAYKVGIADVLIEEQLPAEPFDIPMTHLVTVDSVLRVDTSG